jgi:ketosteroid isomerase-like protein
MATKTDVLKERYDRFSRGDLAGALDIWSDDFVWDGDDSGLPGSGRHEGKQAAIGVLQQAVGAFDKFELVIDEYVEEGDTVVALGHNNVVKGDQSASVPAVHIWTFRGDQVIRFRGMVDTLQTARLLGLS